MKKNNLKTTFKRKKSFIYMARFEATVDRQKTSGDSFSGGSVVTDGLFVTAVIQLCTENDYSGEIFCWLNKQNSTGRPAGISVSTRWEIK